MKRITYILLAIFGLASCSMLPYYETEGVTLDLTVIQTGAGYCQVGVRPSENAFCLIDVEKAEKGIDPMSRKQHYMQNALERKRSEYDQWKKDVQKYHDGFIADFPSHSLQYGETEMFFNYLEADTDYWVYCFVVDPVTEKPVGDLYCQSIHTKAQSIHRLTFDYRLKGTWDYVYPKNAEGRLVSNVPYTYDIADSLDIRKSDAADPMEYFIRKYHEAMAKKNVEFLYGMFAYNNDGFGSTGSEACFEVGHTYYTAIGTVDGSLGSFTSYKFKWTGPKMEAVMTEKDNTKGQW